MSTFGFQLKGYLEVNITFYKYMIPEGVKLTNAEKLVINLRQSINMLYSKQPAASQW
jgi:hypothetical protein